ncbi:MAG: hypothetical protein V3U69_07180, partial [Bacteroidota bacterium]
MKTRINFSLLMLVAIALASRVGFGQVVIPEKGGASVRLGKEIFGLGIAAGSASGLGISFRHHLQSQLSYGLIGGIIKIDRELSYDFGF